MQQKREPSPVSIDIVKLIRAVILWKARRNNAPLPNKLGEVYGYVRREVVDTQGQKRWLAVYHEAATLVQATLGRNNAGGLDRIN